MDVAGLLGVASSLLASAAAVGAAYQIAASRLVRRFVTKTPAPARQHRPAVTVLKPLCGVESELEDCLKSFCHQNYPSYQVVFGVHDDADPALAVARRIAAEMPEVDISVVIGNGRPETGNPKVANLIDMMPTAKHDVLVIADSDMRVGPDYLNGVADALDGPGVGIATCLYVGLPDGSLWSRLGAMGINHGFLPSVMVAQAIGRDDGCFGATMALTRETYTALGGFESLRDQLADDYLLGAAVRGLGKTIGLAHCLPQSVVHEPNLASLFGHEVRWGRTLASIEGPGYMASVITLPVPLALLAVAIGLGTGGSLLVLVAAIAARLWAVRSQERLLSLPTQPIWLVLARDILSFVIHIAALSGRTVDWRGRRFRIGRNGTLVRLEKVAKS